MGTEISEPLLVETEKVTVFTAADSPAEEKVIPEWTDQITIRALVVSALLGALFCIITHKLNLTVGIIPSLNVAAGLLGFFFVKSWSGFLSKLGFSVKPFTRQENTVIQTCVVACYGIACSGIFTLLEYDFELAVVSECSWIGSGEMGGFIFLFFVFLAVSSMDFAILWSNCDLVLLLLPV